MTHLAGAVAGAVLLLAAAMANDAGPAEAAAPALEIHPAVRLALNARGDLFFEVRAAPGDGWTHLAHRFGTSAAAADGALIARLNGGGTPRAHQFYRVPYALLRDEFRILGLAALFPEDVADATGWRHRVGTARLPLGEESLYRLAFWFTGDGENFRAIMAANRLADPGLAAGQEILIPDALLAPAFRMPSRPAPPALEFGRDAQGEYALWRLRPGDTLAGTVVPRFTDRVDPGDVERMARRIATRTGIANPDTVQAGRAVLIPLSDVAVEHLPARDPRRVRLEMDRLLASRYPSTPRGPRLEGLLVILDPGHGGVDIGAHHHGVWEDDVVYDIALRVQRLLNQKSAARVRLTVLDRSQGEKPYDGPFLSIDRDEAVQTHPPLVAADGPGRAAAVQLRGHLASALLAEAVRAGGDDEQVVFLSLHADALHRDVRGAMVYVPGERFRRASYGLDPARWRRYSEVRAAPVLQEDRATRLRSEGLSRRLAGHLIRAFAAAGWPVHANVPIRDHVVRDGHSWLPAVLRGNEVPTKVLIEVANVANRADAALLADPAQRERVAGAVVAALIAAFAGSAEPAVTAEVAHPRLS